MRSGWPAAKEPKILWYFPATRSRSAKVFSRDRAMNSQTISPVQPRLTPADSAAPGSNSLSNLGAEQRGRTDFRHLWHTVLEKLWILILCTVAGLFLALGYLARTPKLYQGHVVLEVDIQEPTVVRSDDMSSRMRSAFLASQDALRTIEQNLT